MALWLRPALPFAMEHGHWRSPLHIQPDAIGDPEKGRTVTAHDLRRSFGTRWAKRVMPTELCRLMRNSTPDTTLALYVQFQAAESASELWEAVGNTLGDTLVSELKAETGNPLVL